MVRLVVTKSATAGPAGRRKQHITMLLEQRGQLHAEVLALSFVNMGRVLESGFGRFEPGAHPFERGGSLEVVGHKRPDVREEGVERI